MKRTIINPWSWQQESLGFVWANEVTGGQRVLYLAGHASLDAEGRPLHAGDMRAQLEQTLDNVEAVLRAADLGLANIVRLNYYTTDVDLILAHWDTIVSRLKRSGCQPASTLLGVTRLAFPELLVEMEATAVA